MKVKSLRKLSQHRIKMSNAQVREVDAAFAVFIHLFEKHAFLGAYAKLVKATVSFMSVRLSVRLSVRPHGTRLPLDGF